MELKLNIEGNNISDVFKISKERAKELLTTASEIANRTQPKNPAETINIFIDLVNTTEELAYAMFTVGANLVLWLDRVPKD